MLQQDNLPTRLAHCGHLLQIHMGALKTDECPADRRLMLLDADVLVQCEAPPLKSNSDHLAQGHMS